MSWFGTDVEALSAASECVWTIIRRKGLRPVDTQRVNLSTWRQKLGCSGKVIAGKKIRREISAKSRTSDRTGV